MVGVELKGLMKRLNRFSTRSLEGAAGQCVSRTHYEVTIEHVLRAMVEEVASDLWCIFKHFEIDAGKFQAQLEDTLEQYKRGNSGRPVFSPIMIEWLQHSWMITTIDMNLSEIRSGTLLVALLSNPARFASGGYTDTLQKISLQELKSKFLQIVNKSIEGPGKSAEGDKPGEPGAKTGPGGESALAKYGINFTDRARNGEIDPVFGRDREIRQMVDILARRRKNNPICVGEAGVGKTAVVEGFALRIAEGDVPDILKDVDIVGLDMGLLQAGAGMKGEFENRLKEVIKEVKSSAKPLIVFIDEAHTLIGAGAQAGGGDAANLLKPALARGELRTIAATTWSEYKKYFEKDAALARRFQLVKLDEPDDATTTTMLRGLRDKYEESHGVPILDTALVAAAEMGSRYISGRQHPDKGVDLMDTAAARVRIALTTKPDTLQDLERKIETIGREKKGHERDRDGGAMDRDERITEIEAELVQLKEETESQTERWQKEKVCAEKVVHLRKRLEGRVKERETAIRRKDTKEIKKAETEIEPLSEVEREAVLTELQGALAELKEVQGEDPLVPVQVDRETVASVVSNWTGIPIGKMVRDQAASVLAFEEHLGGRIKGQDHVLKSVGEGIRASKAGLKNPSTPMGVFLFVGPSGVGKTEAALGVADLLFGGEKFMTTINMSEFQEKHTVSRLIGSPPGYVGYGEGGVLSEAVRQRPYSVVLLDEVEKADKDVMNLFYQVFDKGTLSDGEGREVDFKDTVIFMTSNLATEEIMNATQGDMLPDTEELVSVIRPVLSAHFKPALLARMTIIPFFPLRGEAMKEIVKLKVGAIQKRMMESHKVAMEYGEEVIQMIADRCTEVETGARNIDHILSGTMLPQISSQILQQMSEGELPSKLSVGVDENKDFTYTFSDE